LKKHYKFKDKKEKIPAADAMRFHFIQRESQSSFGQRATQTISINSGQISPLEVIGNKTKNNVQKTVDFMRASG